MKKIGIVLLFIVVAGGSYYLGNASILGKAPGNGFNQAQQKQIETIVHRYLVKNPEVLIEVSRALQAKQMQQAQQAQQQGIEKAKQNVATLVRNAADPFAGNPKGTVTMVEFFDYQCIHCRDMSAVVENLIKANKNLKVVFKEFPIFGANSILAAKAALAANKQGKFFEMHNTLMTYQNEFTLDNIMKIAKGLGLDMDKFKADINSKGFDDVLASNKDFGQSIGLMGTPAFFVASSQEQNGKDAQLQLIPGQASQEQLQDVIDKTKV